MASHPRLARPGPEFPARDEGGVRAANQPESTGFRAGTCSRGVTQPVSLVYLPVSLTTPGPSGSARPTRLCRGCSRPPRRFRMRLPPAHRYDGKEMDGLSPPSGLTVPRGAPTSVPEERIAQGHSRDGEHIPSAVNLGRAQQTRPLRAAGLTADGMLSGCALMGMGTSA